MNGDMNFNVALLQRLEVVCPTDDDMKWMGQLYLEKITENTLLVLNNIRFRYPGITLAIYKRWSSQNHLQINLVYAVNCDNVNTSKILNKWIGENKGARVII